ncbi:MAG: hypothetical protein KAS32_11955 [Candidatus Peribacteraceae bacterium]|nr:hypothetical protein [Candidatus Peribacteraceae bacterium]
MTAKQERSLKKRLKKEADLRFHKACLKMWGDVCFFHKHPKQAKGHVKKVKYSHHFLPKSIYGWLRYCLLIGVPICWACHYKLEQGGDKSMNDEIIKIRGMQWFNKIQELSNDRKTSFESIDWYREQIRLLDEYLSGEN